MPTLPAQWLTTYNALSSETGLVASVARGFVIRRLDARVGASGPHTFVVRKQSVARLTTPPASTASRLAYVTTRPPLVS
jgi:hypothetical protein